jgi:hypothetical protein
MQAGIAVTRASMLQSSSQPDAHKVGMTQHRSLMQRSVRKRSGLDQQLKTQACLISASCSINCSSRRNGVSRTVQKHPVIRLLRRGCAGFIISRRYIVARSFAFSASVAKSICLAHPFAVLFLVFD